MLRSHIFWTRIFIVTSILTALVHSISFLVEPVAANDTEAQLIHLMATYKMDAGSGFNPTMRDLFNALSSCFTLVYFLGALTNWYLLHKKVDPRILKGISGIQAIIFGGAFLIMLVLTFLPPIVLTGLSFLFITLAYLFNKGTA
jgi:hypothetical protein